MSLEPPTSASAAICAVLQKYSSQSIDATPWLDSHMRHPRSEDEDRGAARQGLEARLAIAEAMLLAISRRDEVLRLVGDADDDDAAREQLQSLLGVDLVSANAILDMQFRRLPTSQRAIIRRHRDELLQQLRDLG